LPVVFLVFSLPFLSYLRLFSWFSGDFPGEPVVFFWRWSLKILSSPPVFCCCLTRSYGLFFPLFPAPLSSRTSPPLCRSHNLYQTAQLQPPAILAFPWSCPVLIFSKTFPTLESFPAQLNMSFPLAFFACLSERFCSVLSFFGV